MELNYSPPLLSRILLAVTAVLAIAVAFVFLSRALAPAVSPEAQPIRQAQTFNPKADVAKNPVFPELRTVDSAVPDMPMGRSNPFVSPFEKKNPSNAVSASASGTVSGVQTVNKRLQAEKPAATTTSI